MGPEQSKFAPAIVEFENENGASWIAYVANNDSNTLLVIANDGALWAPHTVVNEASKCAPAVATFDGKIWMAFVANNDSNTLLLTSTRDGVHWTREKPPNESSKCSPALAVNTFPPRLYMAFVANNDSNDLLVTSTDDGVTWTRGPAPNESSKCAPALVDSNDPGFPALQMAFVANNDSNDLLTESIDGGL